MLKLNGVFTANTVLYDQTAGGSPVAQSAGTSLSLNLTDGHVYYLYNRNTDASLKIHSLQYTLTTLDKDIEFRYFEWRRNQNANNKRLDRRIPYFDVTFNNNHLKYESGADEGVLSFQVNKNVAENSVGTITITPRVKEGASASDFLITGVTMAVQNITGTPKVNITGGAETTISGSNVRLNITPTSSAVTIQRTTTGDGQGFKVTKLTVHYTLKNGKTLDEVLDQTKAAPYMTFNEESVELSVIGAEYVNQLTLDGPKPEYNTSYRNVFGGTITCTQTNDAVATLSFSNATTGDNDAVDYKATVELLSIGATTITASYAGNEYFAAAEASFTVSPSKFYWSSSEHTYPFTSVVPSGLPTLTNDIEGEGTVTYSSSKTDVASFGDTSDYGSLRIKAVGETTITATHSDGTTAEYVLTVTAASGSSWDFCDTYTKTRDANNFGTTFWVQEDDGTKAKQHKNINEIRPIGHFAGYDTSAMPINTGVADVSTF